MQIYAIFTEKNGYEKRSARFCFVYNWIRGAQVMSCQKLVSSFFFYIYSYSTITRGLLGRFRLSQAHSDAYEQGGQGETLGQDTRPHHVLRHLPIALPEAPQAVGQGSQGGKTT